TGTGTVASVKAIQQENLIDYYKKNYFPNNAAVVVVGDITQEEAKQQLEKVFANWKPGEVQTKEVPTPPAAQKTQLYLVDKPGAAQSMIFAGNLGIRRNDPDFVPTIVMNRALGGKFSSRINMNLREDKGYTYGAGSGFMSTRGVGAFQVRAPVQTPNTKESIVEILKELRDVTDKRPLTEEELADTKNDMLKGFPQQFQTFSDIAARLGEIFLYDLPDDEWQRYMKKVSETTSDMTTTAAKSHIHPEALVLVVVGDRAKIEPGLRELGLGEMQLLQPE
ncbi:MAG TPA: pitrilysin family protein, partial [Acidobacteriota bacterium]